MPEPTQPSATPWPQRQRDVVATRDHGLIHRVRAGDTGVSLGHRRGQPDKVLVEWDRIDRPKLSPADAIREVS